MIFWTALFAILKGLKVSLIKSKSFFASVNSNLSSLIRLKRRFFRTSDPFLLTNNFKPAFATGIRSELIFSGSLNKIFSKLSTFSIWILDILLEVVFDKKGQIQIEKVESLLNILFKDSENINSDLIPVANAGLKLFVSKKGSEVRKNLLLSLIKDEKLEFTDAKKLLALIRDTFSPLNFAKSAVQNIISTV